MKRIIIIIFMLMTLSVCFADTIELSEEEKIWLEENQDRVFTLGLDPYTGMDYFLFQDMEQGYVVSLVEIIESSLDIQVEVIGDQTWSYVYNGLINQDIDILFGANVTEERLKFMSFTEPVHRYPYAVFVKKEGDIKTLGDMDFRKIGFLEGDIAIELFSNAFENINFQIIEYDDQIEGLEALSKNNISGFVTSGGGIEYDFIYQYTDIKVMTSVEDITSDMTLATHLDQEILAGMLDKVIESNQEKIKEAISKAQVQYNRKILNFSEEELKWFKEDGVAIVGIVEDYLPFDYYHNGLYKGIAGSIIDELSKLVGIEFELVYGDFDTVYDMALRGKVDVLNIAKTPERQNSFYFPRSFLEERDIIYGHKSEEIVNDIYGLNGKKVAVIKGFWHEQLLLKNVRDVEIVLTKNIQESLKFVNSGKVDYFIENPTVAEYYISGLGYQNILKKGETSSDSFLYFGVVKQERELANIIDKTLILINYDEEKQEGLSTVPKLVSKNVTYLLIVIVVLLIIVSLGAILLVRAIKTIIAERETSAVLKDREHQMYLDPLTGLNNRLFFNLIENDLDEMDFPQAIIMSDLNKLKHINDTMGHHVGDIYIQRYGEALKSAFMGEIVCRMGGDEFLVIMKETDESKVRIKLEKLRNDLGHCKIEFSSGSIEAIDVAIGYHMRKSIEESLDSAMVIADDKMYQDKNYLRS